MFTGDCIGVSIKDRGRDDPHQCVEIFVEDDELWHLKISMSSFWLDEMIAKLVATREYLDQNTVKGVWGYTRN